MVNPEKYALHPLHTPSRVFLFHRTYGHPVAEHGVQVPAPLTRLLRFKLLFEEVMEFGRAVGIAGLADKTDEEFKSELREATNDFAIIDNVCNLIEAADALADIDYVTQGANLVFGFPAEAVAEEVHASNMSKLDENGNPILAADGKVVKGPYYRPPDIAGVLRRTGSLR